MAVPRRDVGARVCERRSVRCRTLSRARSNIAAHVPRRTSAIAVRRCDRHCCAHCSQDHCCGLLGAVGGAPLRAPGYRSGSRTVPATVAVVAAAADRTPGHHHHHYYRRRCQQQKQY